MMSHQFRCKVVDYEAIYKFDSGHKYAAYKLDEMSSNEGADEEAAAAEGSFWMNTTEFLKWYT